MALAPVRREIRIGNPASGDHVFRAIDERVKLFAEREVPLGHAPLASATTDDEVQVAVRVIERAGCRQAGKLKRAQTEGFAERLIWCCSSQAKAILTCRFRPGLWHLFSLCRIDLPCHTIR